MSAYWAAIVAGAVARMQRRFSHFPPFRGRYGAICSHSNCHGRTAGLNGAVGNALRGVPGGAKNGVFLAGANSAEGLPNTERRGGRSNRRNSSI